MKRLDALMGKFSEFFVQYGEYLSARRVVTRYNLNKKVYNRFEILYTPKEVIDAQITIFLWKERKT